MDKKNNGFLLETLALDEGWSEYVDGISASAFGLTVEQYREWSELKTNEEMDAYIRKYSNKTWDERSGQGKQDAFND